MKLSNEITAVVTGGASGLGEATARAFAAKGVKVGIFDMNAERGAIVASEIGGVFAKVNVADEASVDAGFEAVRAENGTATFDESQRQAMELSDRRHAEAAPIMTLGFRKKI